MKTNKIHSVKYNFIMNFFLSASSFIFPLITFPYISRVLLAEGNGKISFYSSVANYFLLVASLGIPTYGIRACAKVRDDLEELSKTVKEILTINRIMTTLVIVTYVISFFCVEKFSQEPELFIMNGISIILNMFGMTWLFQALEQYDYITIRSLLLKVVSISLMFLFVHSPEDYKIQAGITVFASCGFNLFNYFRARKYVNLKFKFTDLNLKRHLKPIFVLFSQSLAISVYTNLDTVMLGFMKGDTEVGYYNAAIKLKYILLSLVFSLGQVLLPRMSYYVKNNMKDDFLNTMQKALNFTLELALPLSIYFVIFSFEALMFLAGKGYIGAVTAMQIITVAIIPNGLTGILGTQVLTSIEKEKFVLISVVIGAVSDFFLNIICIPQYGAAGAALATTICEFIVLFVQIYFCRTLLKLIWRKLHYKRYIIISMVATITILPIKKVCIDSYLLCLIITSFIYFGSYLLCLIIIKDNLVLQLLSEIGLWFKDRIRIKDR